MVTYLKHPAKRPDSYEMLKYIERYPIPSLEQNSQIQSSTPFTQHIYFPSITNEFPYYILVHYIQNMMFNIKAAFIFSLVANAYAFPATLQARKPVREHICDDRVFGKLHVTGAMIANALRAGPVKPFGNKEEIFKTPGPRGIKRTDLQEYFITLPSAGETIQRKGPFLSSIKLSHLYYL